MSFERTLARLQDDLQVPYPARQDLIAEIGDHLEALYDEYRREGAKPEVARARAIEAMALDETFIASIDDVHAPLVARALARLPRPVSLGIEYAGITLAGAAILFSIFYEEATMLEFFLDGGFFMIPLNLAGILILLLAIERAWSLFIKKDHSAENLGRRLLSMKFLGGASALTGLVGTAMGFFQAFAAADRIPPPFPILEVARIALTTTIWGLTLALAAMTIYFVFKGFAERIRVMRVG